ncbi:MAG: integration host factor subunit beta [Candidatus Schekmanbacteria bacterium RIFCSPHIGHO2_02_FULL_38_11]|uniref:Integration host factor subunit beta n=1 Tax=Candidatus Schekmanbacteria bacterium RIFCSPLOWO2_12_FULL_38_15 TaxID=1817883 RepID=A0A1F7SIY3_9BACT|nr:MAG: integration host factor subunit beta [Candidatus Schekmanbacteria bacterium GWA2_38_9]OGL47907.1 MAG: integration host factor subunit beta [Candidatus Schekmanbacteria bacterium RIFCSPHIGHO2_02_FULL_38_11]OGL49274.1 MAG: integration host factor subunit beta [Candidatus Schekmanbacteria bacterium RIFCSPLOWO2_02_FULL_38_14]OGL53729.1 MAG: integration host factor subunit beta [Candidatus Schekmanbacteria bacterium RIFCSPLOWO2_12_FULL_38_15]
MTKTDLIQKISEKVSFLNKKQTDRVVNCIFENIKQALEKADKVEIRGFGSFTIRKRDPREGRNPLTGEKVYVPAKKVPFFRAGKELKKMVNTSEKA